MAFSKQAVWLAVNSEYGDRLVEIAQEHLRLAREMSNCPFQTKTSLTETRAVVYARIEQLRKERDSIIQQFEEVETNDRG